MKTDARKSNGTPSLDPLYVIFEEHLYNIHEPENDRRTFLFNIVQEYLTFLRRQNIAVPKSLELPIIEELMGQVNTMLVRKIYGAYSINEFQKRVGPIEKRKARTRYKKISAAGATVVTAKPARKTPARRPKAPASLVTRAKKKIFKVA